MVDLWTRKKSRMMHYIGFDIGGTRIAGGIVTSDGKVVARMERSRGPGITFDSSRSSSLK